ncbi:helicase-exonuclease AddAB subunit AddA [Evansella cellulosilytica]|uniref:ATP-dependent helicase/nuclease subunit A n=1 Tax=Evansella cellulosilytica (strain ATCC 21833 / DSM 2522 / FERM P-1141 / JCM 9156 / N-4) TaxID=649639 RepID=E6U0B1_EVAC2|nr:helicase-exonuclease AddAB subunit AddA [Evansella cellulosilytica]ADU30227.1 recombination helicase AddA [Evansella cellulosilytica DSM 2522]
MKISPKPKGAYWTDDQWKAIDASGNNILVAAAAGSGKTAVLVERIIRKIVNHNVDVDQLLIVTFTNAAAAEMRHRIGDAIEKQLKDDPTSLHLRRQLTLLNRANISTLHSFCMKVVRQFYYVVDIDPSFRLLDTTEGELIREEILEELFEEEYGNENNHEFFHVVDSYSGDRSDEPLRQLIRKLYDFSRSHPDPNAWLDELVNTYNLENTSTIEELPWTKELMQDVKLQLQGALYWIEKAMDLTREPNGPAKYSETFEEDILYIDSLIRASTWEQLYARFQSGSFKTIKRITKKDLVDEELKERAKSLRDQAKKQVEAIKNELFTKEPDSFLEELKEMAPSVKTIARLIKAFSERYLEAKKENAVLDFNDLEHFCLAILADESEDGQWSPTRAASEFQDHFVEVLIDEYQDTNLVQETIVSLLSKGNNRFMVGDVKQSIYRFRLAEPTLFLNKYKEYKKEGDCEGWRIDLAKNFRSRCEILDATNYLFRQMMDETVGEINYDSDAELRLGNEDYLDQDGLETEVAIINKGKPITVEDPGDTQVTLEEDLETSQMETRFIIKEIKRLIKEKYPVYDKNLKATRPVTYRDIVILMRSMPWAATMMDECKQEGIPIYADLSTGYFDAVEVRVMMSLLKVIDNPYQDVAVASVLRSPIYQFNEQQLAHVRIMERDGAYYDAIKKTAEQSPEKEISEKARHFLLHLERWRTKARSGALSDLIWELYRETGYYDYVGGMPGGKQRQANLRALYDRARAYEATSFRGLFRFLHFVERMQERGDDLGAARALGEQEDVVRIMTIHKSKGLEFPIVFVAGANKKFNMQDLRGSYLLHKDLGFGSKYIDPKLRVAYPSLPQLAIKKRMHLESLAEEMRVLYVALTRAKEKLYLIGTVNEAEKSLHKWKEFMNEKEWLLPAVDRQKGNSYLDWIGPAVLRHHAVQRSLFGEEQSNSMEEVHADPSKWFVSIIEQEDLKFSTEEKIISDTGMKSLIANFEKVPIQSSEINDIINRLEWRYRYNSAAVFQSKQTVSDLKRQQYKDEYSGSFYSDGFQSKYADRPKFLQKEALSSAERGTVIHAVMQHISLSQIPSEDDINKHLFYMVENELLTKEQANAVNIEEVLLFFESPIGKRLINAEWVEREIPFSIGIDASNAYTDWGDSEEETVLIQGVIDCVFKDELGVVLLDYKTDAIENRFSGGFQEAYATLKERYNTQMKLYIQAVEMSWNKPVDEAHLYFFDGGYLLTMKGGEL